MQLHLCIDYWIPFHYTSFKTKSQQQKWKKKILFNFASSFCTLFRCPCSQERVFFFFFNGQLDSLYRWSVWNKRKERKRTEKKTKINAVSDGKNVSFFFCRFIRNSYSWMMAIFASRKSICFYWLPFLSHLNAILLLN